MPATYDLINDYGSPDQVVSLAPMWVLAVVRWAHPFLFDRAAMKSSSDIDPFERAQAPLIITSDCSALSIVSSKAAHVSNLNATLRDNNVNYLSSVYPDDWLMAWILPNETRARQLIARLNAGQQANDFQSGLKFVGRVESCFKDTAVDDQGRPTSVYTMTGVGFGEFDYTQFWEPLLALNDSLPVWYQRLGIQLNAIVTGSDKSVCQDEDPNVIDVNKMIPALVRLCLGEGPFQNGNVSVPGGPNASPTGGVRVPSLVGDLLGMENTEELNYSDITDIVVGVQKYQGAEGAPQNSPLIFQPDGLQDANVTLAPRVGVTDVPFSAGSNFSPNDAEPTVAEYQTTDDPLLGGFPIVQLPFQDTPVWGIMEQFLNPAVNEMYVTLKPDEYGDIFPRLTVRQYPFSTKKFDDSTELTVTTFLELPRWVIDPKMLKRIQVGRSNALRSNFWHIQGTGPGTAISSTYQYVDHPPLTDSKDIERSGLRRVFRTVNCVLSQGPQGVSAWQQLVADMTAGMQLALTGTIMTAGIVSPIAPGDNVQFRGVVYHVERVTHTCSMAQGGQRDWKTVLQVSHGMADEDTLDVNQTDDNLDVPLEEYAGVRNADPATIAIGHSVLDDLAGDS